jgi:hypothetical protein
MKKSLLGLLAVAAVFLVSSVAGRAGTEMAPPPYYPQTGYWVPPPSPAPAPPPYAYYPPPYYAGPPPYYYGPPPVYYGPGPGYYGPGFGVGFPVFFGFGFHGHFR